MKRSILCSTFCCAVVSLTQISSALPNYTAVDLYTIGMPDGFSQISVNQEARDGGQVGGWGSGTATNGRSHAMVWSPDQPNGLDLNRTGFFASEVLGIGQGTVQVGGARLNSGPGLNHAVMWTGTPNSAVDLHPANYSQSHLHDARNGEQVGMASGGDGRFHATVWRGTAASAVDLHPASYFSSDALFTDGTQQVGTALPTSNASINHAVMWSGTPESFVDLHPSNLVKSEARGTAMGFQVGFGEDNGGFRAVRWNGSAASAFDVNGAFGETAKAYAISSDASIIAGSFDPEDVSRPNACIWSIDGTQRIDLHALLPAGFDATRATWIAADGTIYGTASAFGGPIHVVVWVVPEPSNAILLALVGGGSIARRCRRR